MLVLFLTVFVFNIDEMARTFNCGIGMVLIVDQASSKTIKSFLKSLNEPVFEIGKVVDLSDNDGESVKIINMESAWH